MKTKLMTTFIVVGLAFQTSSVSASPANSPEELLMKADANKDGTITWSEVVEMRSTAFARLDRNGDGYADEADRPRGPFGRRYTEKLSELLPKFDVNRDGRIARTELVDAPSPAFEAGDFNDDKTLDPEELATLRSMASATTTS